LFGKVHGFLRANRGAVSVAGLVLRMLSGEGGGGETQCNPRERLRLREDFWALESVVQKNRSAGTFFLKKKTEKCGAGGECRLPIVTSCGVSRTNFNAKLDLLGSCENGVTPVVLVGYRLSARQIHRVLKV